jgi:hypothetical protein
MPLAMFFLRVEFAWMGFKQRLKRPFVPRYHRARLAFLRALVAAYGTPRRVLNWCDSKASIAQRKIKDATTRKFFVVDNLEKIPMPVDMRVATTRLSLQQMSTRVGQPTPEISPKEIVQAYKRAENVRGDGKVPVKPVKTETKKPKVDPAVEELVEQLELHTKAMVDGLISGLAVATAKTNLLGARVENDASDDEDSTDA